MPIGLIDTNVFIHAHARDVHSADCRRLLAAIESGQIEVRLEPIVLYELSYALPRYMKQMSRRQVAQYLLMVLSWPGIVGDTATMSAAVRRWVRTAGLSFADAYLAAVAAIDAAVVYTKNVQDLRRQGISVPEPLVP